MFGSEPGAFRSLRIAAWLATALLVGCTTEPNPGTATAAPTSPPAASDAPMREAMAAGPSQHEASSERAAQPPGSEPAQRTAPQQPSEQPQPNTEQPQRPSEQSQRDNDAELGLQAGASSGRTTPASASDANAGSAPADAAPASAGAGTAGEVALGYADCSTEFSWSHPAVQRQREVFKHSDYDARPNLITELEEAGAAYPDEEHFALLTGLMRVWRILEPAGLETIDLLGMLDMTEKAEKDLLRAYELCPTDHRIAAWLGPLWVKWGRAIGDTDKVEAGIALLQQAALHYPSFITFTQLVSDSVLPASHPGFQRALDSVEYYRKHCNGHLLGPGCFDGPHPPHSPEAAGLYFGDTLAKAEDREGALAWYSGAMQAPEYASWPFRNLLEQRIQTLDTRIAAAATPDTADDEPFWDSQPQCALCHRE